MPPSSTLERSAPGSTAPEGVAISSLEPGTTLVVTTRNSQYRVVTLFDPKHILVRGGSMFRQETVVQFDGAIDGDSGLKSGWILVGLPMQMRLGRVRITSSRVRSISPGEVPESVEGDARARR